MISYDILIKSFVTIKNPALMVDIGVLSLAAMDHGPKKNHVLSDLFPRKMAIKWVMRWDSVAVSENVLLPNLH